MFFKRHSGYVFLLPFFLFSLTGCDHAPLIIEPGTGTTVHVNPVSGDDIAGDGSSERPYRTLEKAIDAAPNGSTVLAAKGTYHVVSRPSIFLKSGVILQGEDKNATILDAGVPLAVAGANNSTITGFTIQGATTGISCFGSSVTITNNNIRTPNGIDCDGNSTATISNNTITGSGGNGITVRQSAKPKITGNTITGKNTGILCQDNSAPILSGNIITNNTQDGVRIEGNANADLGGGSGGSPGGNILQGNISFDLRNTSPNPIQARNNTWDHTTAQDIDRFDIYDDDEGAALGIPGVSFGAVDFESFK
jgi:parallel beta-helix repeat protein